MLDFLQTSKTNSRVYNANFQLGFSVLGNVNKKLLLFLPLCSSMQRTVFRFRTEPGHIYAKPYILYLQLLVSWKPAGGTHELSDTVLVLVV